VPARAPRLMSLVAPASIGLGCFALMARPAASLEGLLVIVVVGIAGVLVPLPPAGRNADPGGPIFPRWFIVFGLGAAAFVVARRLAIPVHAPATLLAAGATVLAALAEEAFFRRLVYGWLATRGAVFAVTGAALVFALVHIPGYGTRVVPLNLAAGLLLGWQRWASGGWSAPALTHALANLLQIG
jgi:membrane protease YdiL (CAAX protease family)